MRTSEHVRAIAKELEALIDSNTRPARNYAVLRTLDSIHVRTQPTWARSLIRRLTNRARQFYTEPVHPLSEDEADMLLNDMRNFISGLREGASSAERRGD